MSHPIQLSTREASTAFRVSVRTVQRWAAADRLPAVKHAGRWSILLDAPALDGFKPAALDKARELLDQGGIAPTGRPGLFTVVSSDGSGTYLTHAAVCSCPAGRRARACYHRAAVLLVLAVVAAKSRPLTVAPSPIVLPARLVPVRGGAPLDTFGEYEYALERAS